MIADGISKNHTVVTVYIETKSLANIINCFMKISIRSRKATADCKNPKNYHTLQ